MINLETNFVHGVCFKVIRYSASVGTNVLGFVLNRIAAPGERSQQGAQICSNEEDD